MERQHENTQAQPALQNTDEVSRVSRYVVTGATGFTGGALAARLRRDGHDVVALVRASSDTADLVTAGAECVVVDLQDSQALTKLFSGGGFTAVFHIAAAYRTEHADESEFFAVNVEATRSLLQAAKDAGIERFVHCSTVGVQGEITEPPAAEDYRMNPGDHYQESKLQGENVALEFARDGLGVSVVRPVGIYGPGDTRFLKLFRAIDKRMFLMIGSGKTLYHLTYIDDLIDGMLLAASHPAAIGEVFTLCGPEYTDLNELVRRIAAVMNKPASGWRIPAWPVVWAAHVCDWICKRIGVQAPLYPRRVEFFLLDRAFTEAKARKLIGYHPRVRLDSGLRQTFEWYAEQGLLK